jgi:aquaporin Z
MLAPVRKYVAEFIGTLVLVLGGVGSTVLAGPHIGNLGIAIAFGVSLLVMAYAIGPISGCHINPAVTGGMLLAGRIGAQDAAAYVAAQVLGGIAGAGIVYILASGAPLGYDPAGSGLAANGYGEHSPGGYDLSAAFVVEAVLTLLMVLTVLLTTDAHALKDFAGVAMGLVLVLIHLIAQPVTNTSVNPARSIGPALIVGGWAARQLWLFILAPLLGGASAALLYRMLTPDEREPPLWSDTD